VELRWIWWCCAVGVGKVGSMDFHFQEDGTMRKRLGRMRLVVGLVMMAGLGVGSGAGQAVAADAATEAAVEATRVKMTAVRDAFVKATVDAGFRCTIAVPKVVVMDVPSYGNYDVERNVVETPAWELMSAREKGLMYQLAGPGADEAAARAEFETDAHHWIFVHELGHWWQACRGVAHDGRHYAKEYGANRIATAYWRERDSAIVPHMRGAFEMVVAHAPNPVPAGHEVETYFDAHYETLGPSPAYPWFQSRMSLVAFDEKPEPTFAQALAETKP